MTGYGSRIGKEAVYGNQSCNTRENSEQRVERDASGDQEDAVLRDTMIDPQKNVLPPRTGICEGVSADRPRPASSGLRSPVAGLASPERRRANPSAISRTLNPIAHKGASSDDVTPAVL